MGLAREYDFDWPVWLAGMTEVFAATRQHTFPRIHALHRTKTNTCTCTSTCKWNRNHLACIARHVMLLCRTQWRRICGEYGLPLAGCKLRPLRQVGGTVCPAILRGSRLCALLEGAVQNFGRRLLRKLSQQAHIFACGTSIVFNCRLLCPE